MQWQRRKEEGEGGTEHDDGRRGDDNEQAGDEGGDVEGTLKRGTNSTFAIRVSLPRTIVHVKLSMRPARELIELSRLHFIHHEDPRPVRRRAHGR